MPEIKAKIPPMKIRVTCRRCDFVDHRVTKGDEKVSHDAERGRVHKEHAKKCKAAPGDYFVSVKPAEEG